MTKNIYKSHLILIFVLLFTTILSACTSTSSKIIPTSTLPDINSMLPQDPEPGKAIDVFLYVTDVITNNNGHVEIIFNTNLPNDMELFAFLRKNGVNENATQKNIVVKYGTAKAIFDNAENGKYGLYVSAIVDYFQPKTVQNIVGKDYRNLTGKLMNFSDMGYTIEYIDNIEVK